MRVVIIAVDAATDTVTVHSELGVLSARWHGPRARAGDVFHVEMDIDDRLVWGDTIAVATGAAPTAAFGEVVLAGTLENAFDDGVAVIRFGASVVQVEAAGEPPAIGVRVVVRARRLSLHDVNL